ncbi:MAG: VWA domain-containing protein [Myxococcales bacterium]|nr:VWA domain-containing protein [Myxococcales bacterium]
MRRLASLLATSLAVTAFACGDPPSLEGSFRQREPKPGESANAPGFEGNNANAPKTDPALEQCATATASADKLPVHMVVVLDKSGSMCEFTQSTNPRDCNNPSSKWQQATKSLSSFFASPQSSGITVSLIAFPQDNNTCSPATYQSPLKADVALPDTAGVLSSQLAALRGDGSTPTKDALVGAIAHAKSIETRLAGKGKVVIVMATDGLPAGCNDAGNIQQSANEAANVKATIPTFVIGVGNLQNDLDKLAAGGGTQKAFIVSTQNAGGVGDQLTTALQAIRGQALACEYAVPSAPQGETLDFNKVNVQYTGAAGAAQALSYSASCADAGGWKYDDPQAPKKIMLCPSACDTAKADAKSKVDVVLGCETKGGTPR